MLIEKQLIHDLSFSTQDRIEYQEKGARLVKKMFPASTIHYLQASVKANFKPSDQPEGVINEFDRFSNEFANRDELFKELAQTIVHPLYKSTGDELIVTHEKTISKP